MADRVQRAGPWTRPRTLPASFNDLPDGPRWEPAHASVPPSTAAPARAGHVPVSSQPAELIRVRRGPGVSIGARHDETAVGELNTDSVRVPRGTHAWVLPRSRAGGSRRRTSPDRGPSPRRRCRLNSARSRSCTRGLHVLASVPRTPQAAAAVLLRPGASCGARRQESG